MKTAIVFLLFFIIAIPIIACECPEYNLTEQIQKAEFIITGKFIGEDKKIDKLFFTGKIIVSEILKGSNIMIGDTLNIYSNFSNCSSLYKHDANYLLFAVRDKDGLKSSICSFTGSLADKKTKESYEAAKKLIVLE